MKEELLNALYCEFINRVNEVGVDVNRAIAHPHSQALLQYVCGLGPRKGTHLLKVKTFPPPPLLWGHWSSEDLPKSPQAMGMDIIPFYPCDINVSWRGHQAQSFPVSFLC